MNKMLTFVNQFVLDCPALAYKGIEYDYQPVNLIKDGGEQVNQFFYVL